MQPIDNKYVFLLQTIHLYEKYNNFTAYTPILFTPNFRPSNYLQ